MDIQGQPTTYLWATNLDAGIYKPGSMVNDRYQVVHSQVVIDTHDHELPELPDEFPSLVIAYLKLSRLLLHLPRPYGLLRIGDDGLNGTDILLLEQAALHKDGQLLPTMASQWQNASAMRQLKMISQILSLWQPLAEQQVCRTLLDENCVRIDGGWVRILELREDLPPPELTDLGDYWRDHFVDYIRTEVREPLSEFFYALGRGEYKLPEAINQIDLITAKYSEAQPLSIRIRSATDIGTRRDHNEDACYPHQKRQKRSQQKEILRDRVAIICDGLGGHEGGEVASSLAIQTLEDQIRILLANVEQDPDFSPAGFTKQLEHIVYMVNNLLVAQNDKQQRQAQQRMGTTLVMAVAPRPQGVKRHEIYLVHVGDSRAYYIGSEHLYQMTLDDDVSTRETILGYNFYSYSSQRMDGGALIQALGTRSSDMLYPRVQRFWLDEDCLLLLCSDGLSDFDRVTEIYESHLRPILTENHPLGQGCTQLIQEANARNGHDNITVALMRCKFAPDDPKEDAETDDDVTVPTIFDEEPTEDTEPQKDDQDAPEQTDEPAGALVYAPEHSPEPSVTLSVKPKTSIWVWLILILILLGGGAWTATQFQMVQNWLKQHIPEQYHQYIPPKVLNL
ncbi:MAG: PP2C family protein-serine/threonine phosphatase [Pseudanabaenaceae cyanobacterium]|jgi:protein phosphatase